MWTLIPLNLSLHKPCSSVSTVTLIISDPPKALLSSQKGIFDFYNIWGEQTALETPGTSLPAFLSRGHKMVADW